MQHPAILPIDHEDAPARAAPASGAASAPGSPPSAAASAAPSAAPSAADDRVALRQALADLDAARARVERDAARTLEETRVKLIAELLPVLDNLDRSIAAHGAAHGAGGAATVEGVRLVRAQLAGVLRGYGLERFDTLGARFDPREHDAVNMVEVTDRARDGVVVEQWEPGYKVGARLLRPARVAVGRYRPPAPPTEPERPTRPERSDAAAPVAPPYPRPPVIAHPSIAPRPAPMPPTTPRVVPGPRGFRDLGRWPFDPLRRR